MARQTIGEFLQTLRKANGYTQQEVADKLGISNKTLSAWETDRAYPDLLSIPALADLYGVTADEILRGERKNAAERKETADGQDKISDKYERAALNNKFLKFNTQSYILLIPSCAAALLIFAAMFLPYYIGLVLLVIGIIALITAIVLQFLFYRNALIGAGITENEELTIWQSKLKMDVKHTLYQCLKIDGIVYIVLGALMFLVAFIADANHTSYSQFNALYYVTAVIAMLIGIAALVFIYKQKRSGEPTPVYTEKQYAIMAKNKKLLTKCIVGAVVACVVIMAVATFFTGFTFTKTDEVYSGTEEQVAYHLQTIEIEECSNLNENYGVSAGEYYFDLPDADDCVSGTYYDLENGFTYRYSRSDNEFIILYKTTDGIYITVCDAAQIYVGDTIAYNVRYGTGSSTYSDYGYYSYMTSEYIYYTSPEYSVELTDETDGIYTLYATSELYIYDGLIVWIWVILSAVAIVIPTIIYIAKRKKVQ